MTRDDIIRMAKEAGFSLKNFAEPPHYIHAFGYGETLERFAALVAAAEREECAKFLEQGGTIYFSQAVMHNLFHGHQDLFQAVRDRGIMR